MEEQSRWNEITEMWSRDGRLYAIAGFLLGLMAFPLIGALNETGEVQAFLENLAPEAVGILVTVIFIYYLDRRRDDRNAEKARQQQLVDDAASAVNDVANNAVHQLRRKGWLEGENGLLKGANLADTNLSNAILFRVNLQDANLFEANLNGADLTEANLQRANMTYANVQAVLSAANLQGAKLWQTNLQSADLALANLEGADLQHANLRRTCLRGANLQSVDLRDVVLQGADLRATKFNEKTRLPDGNFWTRETNMGRFTDPMHPRFWQSDDANSIWNET